MTDSSPAKVCLSGPARLPVVVSISLFLLGFPAEIGSAEQTFFAIPRAEQARFLPLEDRAPGAIWQNLPAGDRLFFPIERATPARFAVTREPAKASIGTTQGRAPTVIRPDRSFLGLPPLPATPAAAGLAAIAVARTVPAPRRVAPTPAPAATSTAHIWPVDGVAESRVSSAYGWRRDPFTGGRAFHGGLDIAAAAGTPVVATAPGVVKAIGENSRLGRYVILVFADGSVATYGHLRDFTVDSGQVVRRGERLGSVGSTGRASGPHLDYRLEVDGRRIDPLPLLRQPTALAAR
jgi:murein DD-endopeptidase MepM/ murein hydrolase activator NlpD